GNTRLRRTAEQVMRRHAETAVTRQFARLASGEHVDPDLRKMLAEALTNGEFKVELKRSRRGRVSARANEELMVELARDGVRVSEIAKRVSKTPEHVRRVLRRRQAKTT